jgi:hypothetical protein
MRDKPRRITVHPSAKDDLKKIERCNPAEHKDMLEALKSLVIEDDPRRPVNTSVDACRSYPHATNCIRVKRKVSRWRCVIRFLEQDAHGRVYQLDFEDELSDETILQVIFADLRSDRTYEILAARAAVI